MRWLAVWLLLSAILLAVLLLCRWLTGGLHLTRTDAADLLLIPLAQLAALAILVAGAGARRAPPGGLAGVRRQSPRAEATAAGTRSDQAPHHSNRDSDRPVDRASDQHPAPASDRGPDRASDRHPAPRSDRGPVAPDRGLDA